MLTCIFIFDITLTMIDTTILYYWHSANRWNVFIQIFFNIIAQCKYTYYLDIFSGMYELWVVSNRRTSWVTNFQIYFIIHSCPTYHNIIYFLEAESRTHLHVNNTSTNIFTHFFFNILKTFLLQYLGTYWVLLLGIIVLQRFWYNYNIISNLLYSASPALIQYL